MTTRSPRSSVQSAAFTDLAAILALGFLRLTRKRHALASSGVESAEEKRLDVGRRESPHVIKVEQR